MSIEVVPSWAVDVTVSNSTVAVFLALGPWQGPGWAIRPQAPRAALNVNVQLEFRHVIVCPWHTSSNSESVQVTGEKRQVPLYVLHEHDRVMCPCVR